MAFKKIQECCICHKILKEKKSLRLVEQHHDNRETYGAYHNYKNYDFCEVCFRKFRAWIKKHKERE